MRRLLMSEEQKGTHRNRRDGTFDIRNISAIVRQTGNCYKKSWERPAPETHLTILGDFSGSMLSRRHTSFQDADAQQSPLALAVTGMFAVRSEEHTSELQSLMRISYAVFCLKKKNKTKKLDERTVYK